MIISIGSNEYQESKRQNKIVKSTCSGTSLKHLKMYPLKTNKMGLFHGVAPELRVTSFLPLKSSSSPNLMSGIHSLL